jgi:hypothetical protein
MQTQEPLPWIIRWSLCLYRWLLCLGSDGYRRQYGDLTLQLFQACCEDAYRQRGTWGVLLLWPPLLSDGVAQMLAERFSERERAAWLEISVATVSSCLSERRSSMNTWERFNRTVAIPLFSSLTLLRRKLTRPLTVKMNQRRIEAEKGVAQERFEAEKRSWLNYPANMHFEQGLRHWGPPDDPRALKSGVVTSGFQGRPSAFLRVSKAPNTGVITLRQTIKADDYRGKRLRLSGEVKAEQVDKPGGLYIRTDVLPWKHIQEQFGGEQPADPSNRPDESIPQHVVQGTHDWKRYEVTVPVAEDALFIRFGLVLYGKGQLWLADAHLEVVEP